MKKLSLIILSLFCICFGFLSCAGFPDLSAVVKEPNVSLKSADITGISLSGVNMLVHVDVENPNNITIPLPRIDWEVFINNSSFVKGAINNDKSLAGRQTTTIDLPLVVGYEGLYNTVASVVSANEAAYDISIAVTFNIPVLGERVYRLSHSGVLPMIKKPEIKFNGIARKSLGMTMEFVLGWEVENKNNFDFNLGMFSYDFTVNNSRWASGQIENPPVLKAGAKTVIPLTVKISAASIIAELVTIIGRGSAVTYSCTGNMKLQGAFPKLEPFELPLNLQGSTQIR